MGWIKCEPLHAPLWTGLTISLAPRAPLWHPHDTVIANPRAS